MAKTLDKMNLQELQAHQREVDTAIKGFEKKRRADAVAELRAVAKKHGFSLEELTGGKAAKGGGKGGTKGVAKYANPADKTQTWTGRGRQPNWVKTALKAGKSLDSMAI